MKLNKLFLMAAMGLGLFACSENELEGNGPDSAQNEGTTYVGFTLKFNASNTRATTTGEENGTKAEQNIKTAYVVMTNTDGSTIEEVVTLTDAKDGTESNADNKCYVFQTTPGTHYFYAVVNPDKAPAKGGKISEYFDTGVPLSVANIASTTDGGNFMMSSENVLNAYLEDGVKEADALAGKKNSFEINVERVSAKVTMTCEEATLENAVGIPDEPEYGGTVSDLKFNLKGVANMAYRMAQSEWNNIMNNSWTPNEDGTVNNNTLDVSVVIGQAYDAVNAAYCLENMDSPYKQGNTTYLTLRTTFKPANVVDCNDPLNGLDPNIHTGGKDDELTFYVVKEGTLAGNYLMKADLEKFQAIEGNSGKYPEGVDELSGPYTNGECWFGPIWIGQTDTDKDNAPIVRNTWYNLNITGITLPGDPQEPQPDPDQPLVPSTNVAISLTVMPWNFINREIDLQ